MTIILDRVPLELVETMWPHVSAYIQAGCDAVTTSETGENLKAEMLADRLGLWVIFETDTPLPFLGAAAVGSRETNDGLVTVIRCVGGRDGHKWILPCLAELEGHAKAAGSVKMELEGRRGWRRLLTDYTEARVVLEKVL